MGNAFNPVTFCGYVITLKDFQDISDKTPLLADLKPSGKIPWKTCMKLGSSCGNKIY
jgi:dihydroxyacid dehydratase/phosphogluconate dehydratase